MTSQERPELVRAELLSAGELLCRPEYPLAIDRYQRPYVWGQDKVGQLLDDLAEHFGVRERQAQAPNYYLGTVLLHRKRGAGAAARLYIVDGQQRLTTLSLLFHCLAGQLPAGCGELAYYTPESVGNIRRAQACLRAADLERWRSAGAAQLFQRLDLTVITVDSEDLAFTFFDTQNNRGVPLGAADLLKAHHLRAIHSDAPGQDFLQARCAEHWERLGKGGPQLLLERFLWRARRWRGQKHLVHESAARLLEEFEAGTWAPAAGADGIPLHAQHGNRLASHLVLERDGGYRLTTAPIRLAPEVADLPFLLRQPIQRGAGFFLYVEKYAALHRRLFLDPPADAALAECRRFYAAVLVELSPYLRELYDLALLIYLDRFATLRLPAFVLWLDHVLGTLRIGQGSIVRQTPLVFLRDQEHNLLDVISQAFLPEEVLRYLQEHPGVDRVYAGESLAAGVGVQGRYKQRLLAYYQQPEGTPLAGKRRWVEELTR